MAQTHKDSLFFFLQCRGDSSSFLFFSIKRERKGVMFYLFTHSEEESRVERDWYSSNKDSGTRDNLLLYWEMLSGRGARERESERARGRERDRRGREIKSRER
jgi:hypothetical protein